MKKKIFLLFVSIIYSFLIVFGDNEIQKKKMMRLVNVYGQLDLFSGTVLVARGGKIIYAGATGDANKDHKIANDLDSRFNIGSIGKIFTATAIIQLMQEGRLKLSDPIGKYLPDYPFPERSKITIHHLLNHTSGLGDYMSHKVYSSTSIKARRISDILTLIWDQKPEFSAGKRFRYSNSGMVVAGAIIEKVSGMSYGQYLNKKIFTPLGMKNSGIVYPEQVVPNRAIGYIKRGGSYISNVFLEPPPFSDGGLYTTVEDLLKFDQALCGEQLLNDKSKKVMFTPRRPARGYACGWGTGKMYGKKLVGHGGGAPGISAMFYRYIDDHVTVIVLSNYNRAARPVFESLEAIVFDKPYQLPTRE